MSVSSHGWIGGGVCALALFTGACAAKVPPIAAVPSQPAVVTPAPVAAAQPAPDPIPALIAESTRHFDTGERELQLGHLETARTEFNRALEVLLESPYGARTEPRIRE